MPHAPNAKQREILDGHAAWLSAGRPEARDAERGRLEGDWRDLDLRGRDLS